MINKTDKKEFKNLLKAMNDLRAAAWKADDASNNFEGHLALQHIAINRGYSDSFISDEWFSLSQAIQDVLDETGTNNLLRILEDYV